MHTENCIAIAAPSRVVYSLAADVVRWPSILSHYRFVRRIADYSNSDFASGPVYAMGATRSGIPVSWTSIQELDGDGLRILYHHVAGATAGMDVVWSIEEEHGNTLARIDHDLVPWRWWMKPIPSRYLVGRHFVMHIAENTLRGIKRAAEAQKVPVVRE